MLVKNDIFHRRFNGTQPVLLERGGSAVECRTRNQMSPGSSPLCYCFEVWVFSFSPCRPIPLSCINECMAIDNDGNMSDLVVARNCCMARMLPRETELVSKWTILAGGSVKRFERSNGRASVLPFQKCVNSVSGFSNSVFCRFRFGKFRFLPFQIFKIPFHFCQAFFCCQ